MSKNSSASLFHILEYVQSRKDHFYSLELLIGRFWLKTREQKTGHHCGLEVHKTSIWRSEISKFLKAALPLSNADTYISSEKVLAYFFGLHWGITLMTGILNVVIRKERIKPLIFSCRFQLMTFCVSFLLLQQIAKAY